jgi:DNA invertase Pin-like site-specific DNA recombinase
VRSRRRRGSPKSGAGSVEHHGFNKLIAEIGLGNARLAVSLDASRLAPDNRGWRQLVALCSAFGVLIADGECLYDPRTYHDRLRPSCRSPAEQHQSETKSLAAAKAAGNLHKEDVGLAHGQHPVEFNDA